jgi:3-methyladenine DNA glycosylase AlkD
MHTDAAISMVEQRLAAAGDRTRAAGMAAYLKTDMPVYGVRKPDIVPITRSLVATHPPADAGSYVDVVRSLWRRPHREVKYVAIGYARGFPQFIAIDALALYEELIVDGAWWDLVDEVAIHLVGVVLEDDRPAVTPLVRAWVDSPDLWLRRTSIICQVGRRAAVDTGLLADACRRNLDDRDFFIRKAIGWALRDLSRTDPTWVRSFVTDHREAMSGLSLREATKYL